MKNQNTILYAVGGVALVIVIGSVLKTYGNNISKAVTSITETPHDKVQVQITRIMTASDAGWPKWREGLKGKDKSAIMRQVFQEALTDTANPPVTDSYLNYQYPNIDSYSDAKSTDTVHQVLDVAESIIPAIIGLF